MSNTNAQTPADCIAVIGMAGRFPGASNVDEFWQNLREGVESITRFSDEELETAGVSPDLLSHPDYVKAGAIINDIEMFDAAFFGFTPREAELTDPQHSLFMECAWEALENAGYDPETSPELIGLFAGSSTNAYLYSNILTNREIVKSAGMLQVMLGNDKDHLATRVSYKLNLKGPSLTVQTACSTSLVAAHTACQNLLQYQCDIALAGGISIRVPQKTGYLYQEGSITSPDGRCRAFDAAAQGVIGGNGVGVLVFKRLDEALADGDHIHAIIKGSAINNDGAEKVGYTAPSIEGQAGVIVTALASAEVEADSISYVETHGTGTTLGDPIEAAALTRAFRDSTDRKQFCAIGSVKTNIGHLDAAAGVAGLIKTILALKNRMLPPSLHFEQPNPQIDFMNTPFYVNTQLSHWAKNGTARRAGVSSFGMGGTNAHVILEEAPVAEASVGAKPWHLLALSAHTSSALETATANLAAFLKKNPDLNLADVAYTLQVGRKAFKHRRMVVVRGLDDARQALEAKASPRVFTNAQETADPQVVFMFPGDDAQYVETARELYDLETTFRQHVDRCSELLKPYLKLDLKRVLYPAREHLEESAEQLNDAAITQPALFVIEYALAQLWIEWGIYPHAMVGHGIGEYVAACLAGVFSLEDALMLVAASPDQSKNVSLNAPQIPFISSVTGGWITGEEAVSTGRWTRQLRPTNVAESGHESALKPEWILLEVGPGLPPNDIIKRHPGKDARSAALRSLPQQGESQSDLECMLDSLGRLWLAGARIDWSAFHADEKRRRLPLPTYPFERQRYWLEPAEQARVDGAPQMSERRNDPADGFYVPPWKRSSTPRPLAPGELKGRKSNWLLFTSGAGVDSLMMRVFEEEGQDVVNVMAGKEFQRLDDRLYTINPERRADYERLVEDLIACGLTPQIIAHSWGIESRQDAPTDAESISQSQRLGFSSLMFLTQALNSRNITNPVHIMVVSAQDFLSIFGRQTTGAASGLLKQMAKPAQNRSTDTRAGAAQDDAPPRNEVEETIVAIWKKLFGLEHVSVGDNFFDLGGHSLLAIQLASQLRDAFGVELSIDALFGAPTVADLANVILEAQLKREFGDLDQLLASIEELSQDAVEKQIAEELQLTNSEARDE